ncbi:T3SS (YopN, CesT) and YbjN peptide-binding chaperone 1 [Trinickia violacea]|uniref:T3SS (YopN, CesT) and YbjN peptide-binding chaperone 1 n=1 Tax=Trinickia violacea TaxID=2571746 RepID=UPI003F5CC890
MERCTVTALRQATSTEDLEFDEDRDVAIGCRSAVVFVRLIGDQQHVRLDSRILSDVADDPRIFSRLDDINANEALVRLIFRNQTIYGLAEISSAPFVPAHVVQLLHHFCTVADSMGALLQGEFGGRTALAESANSLTKHYVHSENGTLASPAKGLHDLWDRRLTPCSCPMTTGSSSRTGASPRLDLSWLKHLSLILRLERSLLGQGRCAAAVAG